MSDNANPSIADNAENQESKSPLQALIEWRRAQALTMYAAGKTMTAIAEKLQVDISTISRDIAYLRQEAKEKQAEYIEDLPFRHKMRSANMDKAIAELWQLYENETDRKAKKALLDSITDALLKQAALDGDPLSIERALRAVSRIKKLKEKQEQEPMEAIQ